MYIDIGKAVYGFAVITLVVGVLLGVGLTKGCEYIGERYELKLNRKATP